MQEKPSIPASNDSVEIGFQQELVALNTISWALSQSLDLDRVLELALETLLWVVNSQAGFIHVPAETEPNALELRVPAGLPSDFLEHLPRLSQDDARIQSMIESGEVIVCDLFDSHPQPSSLENSQARPADRHVWVCLPLLARGRFQGLMSILMEELTPDRARLLKNIGQHAATAVDNAQLYRRAQQDAQRLSRQSERWRALNQAAVAVSAAHSEQDVYDTIAQTLSNLGFSAAIFSLDADSRTLHFASCATSVPRLLQAFERLVNSPVVGFSFPLDQFDFYGRIVERSEGEFVELGTAYVARLLPQALAHLAPHIVRRARLDYGIAVPLKIHAQTIAIMLVVGDDLVPGDVSVVTAFADQASAAIENARLIEVERHQRQVAEMLHELVVTVNSTLDVDQVLNIAVHRLQLLHQAAACSVSFLDDEGEHFVFRATTDPAIDVSQRITFPIDGSIAGRAIRQHKVQLVNNVDVTPDHRAEIARRTGIASRSLLTAPLFADDQPLGVIQIVSTSPNAFSPASSDLLATTAALIETAIARAQAYARAVQLAQAERHQREVAETLRQVATLLNFSLDLDTVLDRILEQLAQVVDYDSTSLMLVDDDRLTVRASRGFEQPDAISKLVIEIENNRLFQEMAASRRPMRIPDVKADERYTQWAGTAPVRSWIGVPLVVRGQVIGQLAVDKHEPNFYDEDDAELALTFAQQAAIAIENAQLFDSERRQREIAESLQEAATVLNATLDLDTVLTQILEQLRRVVEYDSAGILLEDGDDLLISDGIGFEHPDEVIGQRVPLSSDDPAVRVFKQRHPLIVTDVHEDPTWLDVADAEHVRGWIGTPLMAGDVPIGVLTVDSARVGAYRQEDAQVVESFANQAALAIQNARLFQAAQKAHQLSDSLREIGASLASTLDIDEVLSRTLERLGKVVAYDSASVMLMEDGLLRFKVGRGFPSEHSEWTQSFSVSKGSLGYEVYHTRKSRIVPDTRQEPRWVKLETTEYIRCWLGVPLAVHDRLIGVLNLDHHQPGFYCDEHAAIASAFATHAAIAIENARLHQALQDYAAELETRVEARTVEADREHERLLAVLENAGEAIAIANVDGIIEYANPAWEKLTGRDIVQTIQYGTRIVDEETLTDLLYVIRDIAQPERVWRKEMTKQRPDGTTYVIDLAITPVFDDSRTLVNLVAIYRDVTQYKELDRIKSEFLSTAAHELRSPLTSILGFSELLLYRQDLSQEERVRFLRYINDHAVHLKQLVSDLLDISRIESGADVIVQMEPLDLWSLFEEEISSWREAHPKHTYTLHGDQDWPKVHADRERTSQVMRNLLSNATKYSPQGGNIVVNAASVGGFIEVTVTDEGIGMTEEELAHIFEKFWRADASSTAVEGTGLGLVIVKYIVEQHGGHIWVQSTKNVGTTIHFTLPLVERQVTVLIVEDEAGVREVEQRILVNNGIGTLVSNNGKQAIELAQTHRPDLILLDLMMPGMSGRQVLHALKSNPATQYIPVLVVSARSSWHTIEESYSLGAVDFLTKPFEYQELLSRVRRALKVATSNRQLVGGLHLPPVDS